MRNRIIYNPDSVVRDGIEQCVCVTCDILADKRMVENDHGHTLVPSAYFHSEPLLTTIGAPPAPSLT